MLNLKAGVIGLGVGMHHLDAYFRHPAVERVIICELDDEKAREARERYPGIEIAKDADDLISRGLDVVSIASYDDVHAEQVLASLETGAHIMVEKPMCLRSDELKKIYSLHQQNPHLQISSNLIMRKMTRFSELKSLVSQGQFGELFHLEGDYHYGRVHKITQGWRGEIPYYSVVLGGMIHVLDLLLWLSGKRVHRVFATGCQVASRGSQFRYNDMVTTLVEFTDGTTGKFSSNYGCVKPHFHEVKIFGTKGTYENAREFGRIFSERGDDKEPVMHTGEYRGTYKGKLLNSFIEQITSDEEPVVSHSELYELMMICLAIEDSISTGVPVELQPLRSSVIG